MNLYEHTIIARQDFTKSQLDTLKTKYTNLITKNKGEIVKIEDWGLLSLAYKISKNNKGNYLHFKLKGNGTTISELEKNERIDKNLLRFLTVKVEKFDLEKTYFPQEENKNFKNKNYEKKI
tara:strand:+ start:179 stop:541 length:363 start_codon:yes stop_codon:yes gene_type:complete